MADAFRFFFGILEDRFDRQNFDGGAMKRKRAKRTAQQWSFKWLHLLRTSYISENDRKKIRRR